MDYGVASSNAMLGAVAGASSTLIAGAGAAADMLPAPTPGPSPKKIARQDKRAKNKIERTKKKDERNFIEDRTAQSASDDMYNDAIEMFENNNMA